MSDLQLNNLMPFLNLKRPTLQHFSVTVLPKDVLGPELSSQLESSLKVPVSNSPAWAKSARLWEDLLERYRIPYLLLLVADMRMVLNSEVTALALYEELQAELNDQQFEQWIVDTRTSVSEELVHCYKSDSLGFTPSQRWRPTAAVDVFPYCNLQIAQIAAIRDVWINMASMEVIMDKFLNLHCLETNSMEGTVQFDESATTKLVRVGFFHRVEPVDGQNLIGGTVRSPSDALSILGDTYKALQEIFNLLKADSVTLTVESICCLHKILMSTSRVLFIQTPQGRRFSYLNIGMTRQTSCVNVTVASQELKIQFCPWDQVDAELKVFCERFNILINDKNMDPFAAAAWISHVFVTIHPFEDGNGRLSRILASLPLLRNNLPPLCIPATYKGVYNRYLNYVRANRDGDYSLLMQNLYDGTKASLDLLKHMVTAESISSIY